jgi:hypothetical protein
MALAESVFTKLPLIDFCIKSDINQLRNPEVTGRNTFIPLSEV